MSTRTRGHVDERRHKRTVVHCPLRASALVQRLVVKTSPTQRSSLSIRVDVEAGTLIAVAIAWMVTRADPALSDRRTGAG